MEAFVQRRWNPGPPELTVRAGSKSHPVNSESFCCLGEIRRVALRAEPLVPDRRQGMDENAVRHNRFQTGDRTKPYYPSPDFHADSSVSGLLLDPWRAILPAAALPERTA